MAWRKARYAVQYDSDACRGGYTHDAGNASTLDGAKRLIAIIKRKRADENPRSFQVFDTWNEDENGNPIRVTL